MLVKLMDKKYVQFKNIMASRGLYRLPRAEKKLMKENIKWKNKYSGKRCFIVGNGPSLKFQNLEKLKGEYVFTVNQMMRSDIYQSLDSNFHVIADSLYFNLDANNPEHRKVLDTLKGINCHENKPECFFPIRAASKIEKLGLECLNINYFFSGIETYDGMNLKYELNKMICAYNTVAQYAITIAIYMGFQEIYLLGCDMTGYKEVEQFATGVYAEQTHVYKETAEDMKKALHAKRSCEGWFNGFAKMFTDYRRINDFTVKRGISLINLTHGGVLDSIERKNFEDVVKN